MCVWSLLLMLWGHQSVYVVTLLELTFSLGTKKSPLRTPYVKILFKVGFRFRFRFWFRFWFRLRLNLG